MWFVWGCVSVRSQDDDSLASTTATSSSNNNNNNNKVDADEFDNRTLLDTFGEAAKQYLTQRVIPKTDPECKWDWRSVRCEPFCQCAFAPNRGDYHLGRSCRLTEKEGCDPVESVPEANALQLVIQRMVQGSSKVVGTAEAVAKTGYRKIQTSVCQGMPEIQCTETGKLPVIAWQERLFCQHNIPACDTASHTTDRE
jgi:hypothetical protein